MDRQDIIKKLLENGIQVNTNVIQLLMENPITLDKILSNPSTPKIITENFIKNLIDEPSIIKSLINPKQIKTDDLYKSTKYKFEFLKRIIEENNNLENLISINKISDKVKTFSIIGMVSELNSYTTLEDNTGTANFEQTDKHPLIEDEIIGVACEYSNGTNIIKKITHPDIPLKKTITKSTKERYIRFTKSNDKIQENTTILLLEKDQIQLYPIKKIYPIPIYIESDNLKIFICNGSYLSKFNDKWGFTTEDTIKTLLQKRDMNPNSNNIDNIYLLDIIPDVIVFNDCNESINTTYKGITILTLDKTNIDWTINTKTRETFNNNMI